MPQQMHTDEAKFVELLKMIKGNHNHYLALNTLMFNVSSFRALCQTKHADKKKELEDYLLRIADKIPDRSQLVACLKIVYDDPFNTLLEKSVKSLAKTSDRIPQETDCFSKIFQVAKEKATNRLAQINLQDIHQDGNWFRVCSLIMIIGMRDCFTHWKLFYALDSDDLTKRYLELATRNVDLSLKSLSGT